MAEPYHALITGYEMLRHDNEALAGELRSMERKVSAYKGIIKKMKGEK